MEVRVLGQPEEKVIDKAGPTEAQVLKYAADFDHWTDLNTQAMELIYTICEEKPAESIEEEEWATQRWVKLESQYQDSGFTLRFTKYK